MTKTVLFIHGMFMTPLCWEKWLPRFQAQGYTGLAPAWKFHDRAPAALRAQHPNPALGKFTLADLVQQFSEIARTLNEKPIIVGHSMGGLVTQLLVNRGLGVAGVGIDPAPPQGVFVPSWPFLKSNFPIINPLVSADQPLQMSFEHFQYAFVNTLPEPEQLAAYERYVVPESRNVGRGSLGPAARVEYAKTRVPLLLTAGSADHIIPAALVRANLGKYGGAANVTLREFANRDHFLIGAPGWEEVADAVLRWLQEQKV